MARKPDRALEALRATRTGDLNNELRSQRLLLEARALSDIGRPGVALEVIANLQGREAERLRADILWAAKRWREAGEQIEKMYGERWREFAPLTDAERPDILRAAIGFVLGEDMKSMLWMVQSPAPKYFDWLLNRADHVSAYRYHKRVLQLLQAEEPQILPRGVVLKKSRMRGGYSRPNPLLVLVI